MAGKTSKYFVHISRTGVARPVRVREERLHDQIVGLADGAYETVSVREGGKYILLVREQETCARTVPLNYAASILLGGRGRSVYGDAVLCMIDDTGDYVGFDKPFAQGMCAVLNLVE